MKILVVCVGNVCRSPLAERLLQQRLDALAPGWAEVTSAGTHGRTAAPMERHAAAELVRLGGDPEGHESRRVTAPMTSDVDLLLTLTRDLRTEVLGLSPRLLKRAFTLSELAAIADSGAVEVDDRPATQDLVRRAASHRSVAVDAEDVPDPIGRGDEVHREVADLIAAHVDRIVPLLVATSDART